jgi:tyrosyl-tRNA synthetase
MPLLEGLDGVKKMSKSLGNYIGIQEAPNEIFGKVMSISDKLMWRYIELLSFKTADQINTWRAEVAAGVNPRDIKYEFAKEIVARFHSAEIAEAAYEQFIDQFQRRHVPEQMVTIELTVPAEGVAIAHAIHQAGLATSASAAGRLIEQGGVRLDGDRVEDKKLHLTTGKTYTLQVGKRHFAKVVCK